MSKVTKENVKFSEFKIFKFCKKKIVKMLCVKTINLKEKVHRANESGLNSLLKIQNHQIVLVCNCTSQKID